MCVISLFLLYNVLDSFVLTNKVHVCCFLGYVKINPHQNMMTPKCVY